LQHSVNDPDFSLDDVDLAIRWGRDDWPGIEFELLFTLCMIPLNSPLLITRQNPIKTLNNLKQQIFLHDQPGNDAWREWLSKAGLRDLGEGSGPLITDPNVRIQSAIDGHGLVLAYQLLHDDIEKNRLIAPFDIQLEGFGYYLLYTKTSERRAAFTLFMHWLRTETNNS
jgi:LysR family glycine cleavage system transcriptional activator